MGSNREKSNIAIAILDKIKNLNLSNKPIYRCRVYKNKSDSALKFNNSLITQNELLTFNNH